MRPMPNAVAAPSLGALLVLSFVGCGGADEPEEPAAAEAPADDGTEDESDDDSPGGDAAMGGDCGLPDDLVQALGQQRQLVLNLALAAGDNLESVELVGAPDPQTFRSAADAMDSLDLSGIESNPSFDEPDDVVADLNETADLLEAALAAGTDTADPAWTALGEFYTQEFFVRHNASVNYYLTEAGCL